MNRVYSRLLAVCLAIGGSSLACSGADTLEGGPIGPPPGPIVATAGGQSGSGGECIDGVDCWCSKTEQLGSYVTGTVSNLAEPLSDDPIVGAESFHGARKVIRVRVDVSGLLLTGLAETCGGGLSAVAEGDRVLAFYQPGECKASSACIEGCECGAECAAGPPFDCVADCIQSHRADCVPLPEQQLELGVLRDGQWDLVGVAGLDEADADLLLDSAACRTQLKASACDDALGNPVDD